MKIILVLLFLLVGVQAAHGQTFAQTTASLSWTDNSTNEDGFRLYRTIGTAVPTMIQIPANATTFIDDPGAVVAGQNVCYQLSAYNAGGESAKTPAACKAFPASFQVPVPPGAIGFNWICPTPKVYDAASNTCK